MNTTGRPYKIGRSGDFGRLRSFSTRESAEKTIASFLKELPSVPVWMFGRDEDIRAGLLHHADGRKIGSREFGDA